MRSCRCASRIGNEADRASALRSSTPTRATTTHGVEGRCGPGASFPALRGIESSERLGRYRWVVERTLSWLNRFRRLKVRYERRADIHRAFLTLGCALICWRALPS
jgi:transposase